MAPRPGFPYPAIDPLAFLVDDEIRPFIIDKRQDLTGTGTQACPTLSSGIFIVHEHIVPNKTAEIVMGVFPHCWVRTNVGANIDSPPAESVELLSPMATAGFVLFDATKNNNQPFIVENDYNIPTVAAFPNNTARQVLRGNTFGAADALAYSALGMQNPLTTIYLPGGSIFRIIFRLVPELATANPSTAAAPGLPNPFVIGAGGEPSSKRIDFAGALVYGVRMPQEMYGHLRNARRLGQLGPEASSYENPIGVASRGPVTSDPR